MGVIKLSKIESALDWMITHANDSKYGYDQRYRWGERGDYDCSSAVISAWEYAGVPVKTCGATYTGNLRHVFLKCGFKDVTKSVNFYNRYGLKRGDVLLAKGHHVAMYCGSGYEVEASINEKGKAVGGIAGDQTGKEFLVRKYRDYPWTNCLRYVGTDTTTVKNNADIADEVIAGKWGNGKIRRKRLENAGYNYSLIQGIVNKKLSHN